MTDPRPITRSEAKLNETQHTVMQVSDKIRNGLCDHIRRRITRKQARIAVECLAPGELGNA